MDWQHKASILGIISPLKDHYSINFPLALNEEGSALFFFSVEIINYLTLPKGLKNTKKLPLAAG